MWRAKAESTAGQKIKIMHSAHTHTHKTEGLGPEEILKRGRVLHVSRSIVIFWNCTGTSFYDIQLKIFLIHLIMALSSASV